MLIAYITISFVSTKEESCQNINCECFEDENGLDFYCPSSDWYKKLFVRSRKNQNVTWTCMNLVDMDKFLPNYRLYAEKMIIHDCPLTYEAAKNIDFPNIQRMWIRNSTISPGFVQVMSSFSTIPLEKLVLTSVKLDDGINFGNFNSTNLVHLKMVDVDINSGFKIFKKQPNLEILELKNNDIRYLKKNCFENLKNLKSLDLSVNNIVSLPSETFKNNQNLLYLFLDHNRINFLDKQIFSELKNLVSLDLSHNNICFLHRDVLRPLRSLEKIHLNNIEGLELDDYLLSGFPKLQIISLRSSNLKHIPGDLFYGSTKINLIDIENNGISHIPPSLFEGLSDLETLLLKGNEIETLDPMSFNSLSQLKSLDLSINKIHRIDSELLGPLVNLQFIDLSYNKIQHIGHRTFANTGKLKKINLSSNEYRYVPGSGRPIPFVRCSNLVNLDLSNNFMQNVPQELLEMKLQSLNLLGNKIKSLNVSITISYTFFGFKKLY